MRRREFITLLGGAATAWPLAARAQVSSGRRPLIAWLSGGTTAVAGRFAADFVDGMRELGYVDLCVLEGPRARSVKSANVIGTNRELSAASVSFDAREIASILSMKISASIVLLPS